jgi:Zn-dependent metalloprotease
MSNTKKTKLACTNNTAHICSIHCILPPHMVDHIVKNGSESQRDWALQSLRVSEQFRGQRQAFVGSMTAVSGQKIRSVYDAKQGTDLPGVLVRKEGQTATGDITVDEAYDGSGATYDFYHDVYQRNSIDGRGLPLVSTVHFDLNYDNAFFDGKQMVYGDGDSSLFERFTKSLDVIGHELTHGVTQYEAGLVYSGQPGALNESFSDVFGVLVKQYTLKQDVSKADWIIGAELLKPTVKGIGLRSLKAPGTAYNDPILGKDIQPANMKDYVKTNSDNGGVHINSGIPNHAFYLAAMAIGGNAWEKTGKIWYIALRDRLRQRSTFKRTASATINVAGELFGISSVEQKAVQEAWKQVGVI